MKTKTCMAPFAAGLIFVLLVAGSRSVAFADESLSQKAQDTAQSVEKSMSDTIHKTGKYLKSEKFHQDLKKAVDGTANAIQKGGNWVGHKLDTLGNPDQKQK
jgi:hypothetical protein